MINFVVRHTLDDIIPTPTENYEFVGASVDDSAFLVEKSTDDVEIIKFNLIPPSITPILNGSINKSISNVILSSDKRYIAFLLDNSINIIDLENPNQKHMIIENCNKFSFVSTAKGTHFVYERDQILTKGSIIINQNESRLYQSRKSHFLKNVLWWTTVQKSKMVVALNLDKQNMKNVHVYQIQDEVVEVFTFQIPRKFDYIIPTHVFFVNTRNMVIGAVSNMSATIISYPSMKATCIPYQNSLNPVLSLIDSILVLVVPRALVAFIDSDSGELKAQLVEDKELQCDSIPPNLLQNASDSSIFYDKDRNAFLALEIVWANFAKILETKDLLSWHFIGHISSAHTLVSFFAQDIIRNAPNNFFIGLVHFYLEYCISGVYAWMSPDLSQDLIKYVPHMVPLGSLLEFYPSEKVIRDALISSDLIIPYNNLIKTKFWEELVESENEYCPEGFWHLSTVILLFLFYFNVKGPNSKYPPALINFQSAFLLEPPTNPEHLRAMKDVKESQIFKFLTDFFKKSCAIASALPAPNPDAMLIDKLRFEFAIYLSARIFHLPYNVNKLPTLEYLFLVNAPKCFLYTLSYEKVLQTFSGIMCNRYDLYIRSEIDVPSMVQQKISISKFEDLTPSQQMAAIEIEKKRDIYPLFTVTNLAVERYSIGNQDFSNELSKVSERYNIESLEAFYS